MHQLLWVLGLISLLALSRTDAGERYPFPLPNEYERGRTRYDDALKRVYLSCGEKTFTLRYDEALKRYEYREKLGDAWKPYPFPVERR